jgi:hypothetical protein
MRIAVALGVGVVVAAIGMWAQNGSLVGVNVDDGFYVLLAKALAEGEGYRLTYLPVSLPGVKYPPVYPLSLVPFWTFVGSQSAALYAMKLANGLYIGLAAGLFALLLIDLRLLSVPLAGLVALVGFASGSVMLVTSGLLSEPLYLVLLVLALWLTDRLREPVATWQLAAVGVLAAGVALTRTVGVALVGAVLLATWKRFGTRRMLTVAAAAAITLTPWIIFSHIGSSQIPDVLKSNYGSYLQLYLLNLQGSPLSVFEIASVNLDAMLETFGAKILPLRGLIPRMLAAAAFIAFAIGGSKKVFQNATALAIYPWLYLALVLIWSFPPFRFVFAIFPLLLALAVIGFWSLADTLGNADAPRGGGALDQKRRQLLRRLALAVGLLVFANIAFREGRSLVRRVWDGAQLHKSAVSAEVIDWVLANTDSSTVIAFEFDALIALHTGRPAVPNSNDPVHIWYRRTDAPAAATARLLSEMNVTYLAVRRDVPAAVAPIETLMEVYPGSLELIHVTPGAALILEANLDALKTEERGVIW